MRLNKKALVLMIAVMMVATGFLCYQSYQYAFAYKWGFITASADKSTFGNEENITFHLRSLTKDVEFHIVNENEYDPYFPGGVYVYPIPSRFSPQEYLDELAENPDAIAYSQQPRFGLVDFSEFGHDSQPLGLTWNRTLRIPSLENESVQYFRAPAGYYLLFPQFRTDYYSQAGAKLKLDLSSIFYYDGMRFEGGLTYDPYGGVLAANVDVLAGRSPLPVVCDLNITLETMGNTNLRTQEDRALALVPGVWANTSVFIEVRLYEYDRGILSAVLDMPDHDLVIMLSGVYYQGVWNPDTDYY